MAWTTPRTWATNELVTATLMNQQLRDNLTFLKALPSGNVVYSTNQTTTSTSFVDLPGASITLTTSGGILSAILTASFTTTVSERVVLRFVFDATNTGPVADVTIPANYHQTVCVSYRLGGIAAGSRTVKAQWLSLGGNTITLDAANRVLSYSVIEI